ncbi:MAG: molecular chaperone [Deferribacterales bacterium]
METKFPETAVIETEIYRLFALCFYPPKETILEEKTIIESLVFGLDSLGINKEAEELKTAFAETSEEALELDFARLFIGPFELPCPPYGSVYLEKDRQIMGKTTMDVAAVYEAAGLQVEEEMHEPADHIAIELEFMHLLGVRLRNAEIEKNKEDAGILTELRKMFETAYFLPFASKFADAVAENAETSFYKAVGKALKKFTASTI